MPTKTKPIPMLRPEEIDQFWSQVDQSEGPDSCWEWQGDRDLQGRGFAFITRLGKSHRIHTSRTAYYLGTGQEPGQLLVCHKCDNPSCCNPDHLFLGTHQDNYDDMVAKGRRGQTGKKLTYEAVRQIRSARRKSNSMLAEDFNTTATTISRIRNGRSHKHIKEVA